MPYLAHDALKTIGDLAAQLVGPGAHRSRKIGVTSHDVTRLTTVELTHSDHDRVERRHVAADEHLQPVHHLRPHDDGVDALVRHGTVRGDTLNVDVEPVGVGHALTRRARHRTRVDLTPDMRAVNGVDALERAGVNHGERTYRDFLSRLEQDTNLAFELRFRLEKNADRTEHHGHVRIVAARMHDALVLGSERHARVLGHGKRIDVGAKSHAACGIAVGVVGSGGLPANRRDDTVVIEAAIFHPKVIKLVAEHLLRMRFLPRNLRMLMKQPAPLDDGALGGRGNIANERGGAGSCRFGLGEGKRFGIGARMHGDSSVKIRSNRP